MILIFYLKFHIIVSESLILHILKFKDLNKWWYGYSSLKCTGFGDFVCENSAHDAGVHEVG
jgi:hypothetical protein